MECLSEGFLSSCGVKPRCVRCEVGSGNVFVSGVPVRSESEVIVFSDFKCG